jgi:hypothetical protein
MGIERAIAKAVLTNRRLGRDEYIPGTEVTPDQVCQNGLIRFEIENPGSENLAGYFNVPYIWLLALCGTYPGDHLDYRDFRSKEDSTLPGGFSWVDFEKLMIKTRKIKSHVFDDGEIVTMGQLHRGVIMDHDTECIGFVNHHLKDDVAVYQIETKTRLSNERTWYVEIEFRRHQSQTTQIYYYSECCWCSGRRCHIISRFAGSSPH